MVQMKLAIGSQPRLSHLTVPGVDCVPGVMQDSVIHLRLGARWLQGRECRYLLSEKRAAEHKVINISSAAKEFTRCY